MAANKFYLTTPIYYVNARPHIGHAYSTIVADVLARRHRLLGEDVYFLTGTDEHGQKIERAAAAAGIPPQHYADQVSASFETLWQRMGITNNQFIRTTDPNHIQGVQKLFADLYAKGQIYLSSYTGQYSVGEEMFVEGPPGTIGPDGRPTETVTEENFFFRLSDHQLPLLNLIESNELVITPESSRNEVLAFLRGDFRTLSEQYLADEPVTLGDQSTESDPEFAPADQWANSVWAWAYANGKLQKTASGSDYMPGALRDLSISRSSFTWGIPVPEDIQQAAGAKENHVIYVWLDALANYMTALGYGAQNPDGTPAPTPLLDKFWPADMHLVGKEITRFHCVYWPAFLLALNPKLQHKADEPTPVLSLEEHKAWAEKWLPRQVTANGWLLFDNSKMSKSKGNVVRTETILDAFGTLCPPPPASSELVILSEAKDLLSSDLPIHSEESSDRRGTASAVPSISPQQGALAPEVGLATSKDPDLFAADILRYYLLREIPFGQDGSFSFDSLITRYNADLANGYGNLVSRTLGLIQQNFADGLPTPTEPWLCADRQVFWGDDIPTQPYEPESGTHFIITRVSDFVEFSAEHLWPTNKLQVYLAELALRVSHIDHYLSFHKPWLLAKSSDPTDKKKLVEVLYTAAESIRIITALLYPILPYATARVWAQLGLGDIEQAAANGELKNLQWGGLQPGTKLGPLSPIFPRAPKELAQIMTDMENPDTPQRPEAPLKSAFTPTPAAPTPSDPTSPAAPPRSGAPDTSTLPVAGSTAHTTGPDATPSHTEIPGSGIFSQPPTLTTNHQPLATDFITIDDFIKIELRVAQILLAERIPKADKLLRLEVDLGPEGRRQILSGIAEWYTPEDLLNRKIVVITNLAPRKMRGLESHGMLLAASEEGGKPILATFAEDIPNGTRLK